MAVPFVCLTDGVVCEKSYFTGMLAVSAVTVRDMDRGYLFPCNSDLVCSEPPPPKEKKEPLASASVYK